MALYRDDLVARLGTQALNRRLSDKVSRGGTSYFSANVGLGKDHTLFALAAGKVRFHLGKLGRKYVSVDMMAAAE